MKQAIFLRKILLVALLICAVTTGWFLRGIPMGGESKPPVVTNTPISEQSTAPIDPFASSPNSLASTSMLLPSNASALHKLYALTAGLRPGRGETIPNAEDEKEL